MCWGGALEAKMESLIDCFPAFTPSSRDGLAPLNRECDQMFENGVADGDENECHHDDVFQVKRALAAPLDAPRPESQLPPEQVPGRAATSPEVDVVEEAKVSDTCEYLCAA